jgi:putative drug exporter of the RND superfamily
MRQLARFATRRPGMVLLVWALAFVVALFFNSAARDNVHETDLRIPGTDSAKADDLARQQFGGTISMAILLKGPPEQVEQRGPELVRALERLDGVEVLSPWAIGGARVLREPPGQALLTLQVRKPFEQISDQTTPQVERVLNRYVHAPLTAEVTGVAPLVRALNEASIDSLDQGELIAIPILIVMLLLIFRSPVAALVPAISGLLVTRIGTAAMGAVNEVIEVDALALNMVTMIGLALGVDYSLLIVSRFREELAAGRPVNVAVEESVARAGRTVLFAGTALAVGMLGAMLIAPGALLVSATMGVVMATVLAVSVGLFAMPAGLALLGTNVNRWQFGIARGTNPWVALSERALRKPGVAAFFVLLPLLVLSAPALALDTGPPNVANLPPDNGSRKSYENFERDRGAGWSTPYEVLFRTDGPITTNERLKQLQQFQRQAAQLPGVEAVLGPAALRERTAVLRQITRQIVSGSAQIERLERGLESVRSGTGRLREGLQRGAAGAELLARGLGQAATGSDQIASGTRAATPQTKQLASGVAQTHDGAQRINRAARRLARGSKRLRDNMDTLADSLTEADRNSDTRLNDPLNRAQSAVQSALRNLGTVSPAAAADPQVQRARSDIQRALAELGPLKTNVTDYSTELNTNALAAREINRGINRLTDALDELSSGTKQLQSGIGRTSAGSADLASGVDRLGAATTLLSNGLNTLLIGPNGNDGAQALAEGIDDAAAGSNRLGRGIQRLLTGVVRVRTRNDEQQAALRRNGTDVNRAAQSGYFVLAGVEGAQPQTRTNVGFATNARNGGNTARVTVVPRGGAFDPDSIALRDDLEELAGKTAKEMDARSIVGGPAVLLDDFDQATSARFPFLVITLVLVTFLVLLIVFRSPVLAFCAVILNLVTVGAAVGVLIICFQSDPPLLGGPGYLDAIALSGLFAIIFGLSIDYEVFLISRLLEGRALTGTTEGAIRYSLEKTATIITGAAFIMAAVFLAFAVSPVTNTRQFGVGLTVAVLLDATVVRLILLPALIRLFGERTWDVPAWLDRILPRFSAH